MEVVIGIDLGGTNIKGILMNSKGKILGHARRPTQAESSRKTVINNIIAVIDELKKSSSHEIKKIGMGTPGFIVPGKGIRCTPNIKGFEGFELKKHLEKKTGMKVFVENDAACFTLAEHKLGAVKGCKNVVGVTLGTGVGTGMVINGSLYKGASNGAPEAGHTRLLVRGAAEKPVEVEHLISATAIIKRYNSLARRYSGSKAKKASKKTELGKLLKDKSDRAANQVYKETVFYTGVFLANLINTLSPECIVLGGGVSNLPFYKDVRKIAKKYSVPEFYSACSIRKHGVNHDAGMLGAAWLAIEN